MPQPGKTGALRADRCPASRGRRQAAPGRLLARPLRWLGYACAGVILWVGAYTQIDPPGGYYLAAEWLRLGRIERDWVDLGEISPNLARAVMAAEDARFCEHWGFDLVEIEKALAERERGRVRGASTISQQVAKNVFLWHDPSWVRKGFEAGFTVLIEAIWTKRRILEVYLNTAEFGEGVFGAEAAARHFYGKPAAALTLAEAARLAAVLPDPKDRDPRRGSGFMAGRAATIAAGARTLEGEGRADCLG
jgi:monofunctional biosynthetic peptidoglycan transglycosylase